MSSNNIKEEASKLFKSTPTLRGGIVLGLQLVRDSLQLTDKQKEDINQAIDIVSGVSNYTKRVPRPAEITKLENVDEANNPVSTSESDAKTLPQREDPKPATPDKPTIRRPWDKNPNIIRRPKR